MHNPKKITAGLLMTGAFAILAQGQPAPRTAPAATVPAADQDEMIVLTPFEVNTTRDVGYLATNTLAGSRLNTSLKDTGAAISVLTPEFLSDLGATSMRDVILFSNNSVPDFGDAAPNFNGNPMIGSDEFQLRIRGLTASYARNYFTWETSTDFYNIERLDEARGPNSILFGFGSAGGIVNSTTKQAWLNKSFATVEFLTGSWDRYRGSIDANYALIPKTWGLRVNAVAENGNGWRQFEFDHARRIDLATKFQVTRTSSIRAEVEHGRVKDNVARPWLMIDQTVPWRAAGRPTFPDAQWSPPTNAFVRQTYSDHFVYDDKSKSLSDWNGKPFSYSANQNYAQIAITPANLAIIPINSNPMGPAALRETKYTTYSAFYENQVSDQFSFEIAYNHQVTDFVGYDPNSSAMQTYPYLDDATELFGDASSILPSGAVNPNAGKLYTESNWTRRTQHILADHIRATTAYDFDAGAFGKHRLAGMFERRWHTFYRREDSEVFAGGGAWDENRVFRRHYLTEGDSSSIYAASWQTPINTVVGGKTLVSTWAPNQDIDNSQQRQNTFLGALQSHFLSDHLVTIFGYRVDRLDKVRAPTIVDGNFVRYLDRAHPVDSKFNAPTLTAGAVYHITEQVSLFANTSSSRDLPTDNIVLVGGGQPPMPKATGIDLGAKFDLLKSKLYATVDYYTTKQKNITEYGDVGSWVTTNNHIYSGLQSAGLITAAQATAGMAKGNGYLEDRKADGWEFTLVANPKSNWRVQANFSINNVVKNNIMNEVVAWAKTNQAFWNSKAPGTTLLSGANNPWDTLANQIGWTNDGIKSATDFNGRPARGERKYGANIFTRYTLEGGALKGFYFGGGARTQSRNIISQESNGDLIYGRSLALFDGLLGYEFNPNFMGRKTPIEIQLNVSNLFDSDKYQIYTVAYWDHHIPERIGLQEPRKFTLSAKISF